jgi:hypothetical protein
MSGKPFNGMSCPFCGKMPQKMVTSGWFTTQIKYEIACVNQECAIQPTTGRWVSESLCEDAWNIRTEEV